MTTVAPRTRTELAWSRVDSFPGNFSSSALTAVRPCPVCGGLDGRTMLTLDDMQFFSDSRELPKRLDLVVRCCDDCFALYLHNCYTPYAYEVLFTEAEQSYGAIGGRAEEQIAWMGARGLLRPGAEVLDIGCYEGHFLAQIPEDMRRVGLDIDLPSLERGRRLYGERGVEFVHGDFETFHYAGSPDAITIFHVLEHLPRPVAALAKLRSIAHEGTRLVVEVPLLENAPSDDVIGFLAPIHTTHFTRASLRGCLARAGWRPVEWHEADDYNGCRVVSLPAESAETPPGDPADLVLLHRYLGYWHGVVADVSARLEAVPAGRTIVRGAGQHTEMLYQLTPFFQSEPEREYLLVDRDPVKHGTTWRGIQVHAPEAFEDADLDDAWWVCSSYRHTPAMIEEGLRLGIPPERIVTLYDPETLRLY